MSIDGDDLPEHWPRAGDRLFVQCHWTVDAPIATFPGERFYRMKKAFKTAADLLVSYSEENTHERSNLVWPVVFCYRQYIELALKDMIAVHGKQVVPEILPNWKDHQLPTLWRSYKELIDATFSAINAVDLPEVAAVEACIEEFNRVDAGSYTFRYPTDKQGNQIDIPLSSIDLRHLQGVMEGIYLFFEAGEAALDGLRERDYRE